MAYEDKYRLSVHAVFTDSDNKILQVKATYGNFQWGLPGGSLEPGETIHEALLRECEEELGVDATVLYMSGMYFHKAHHAHAGVFRCEMAPGSKIHLSSEHSEYRYFAINELSKVQRHRILDCLNFDGKVKSAKF